MPWQDLILTPKKIPKTVTKQSVLQKMNLTPRLSPTATRQALSRLTRKAKHVPPVSISTGDTLMTTVTCLISTIAVTVLPCSGRTTVSETRGLSV